MFKKIIILLGLLLWVFAFMNIESNEPSQEDIAKGFHCLSAWDGSHNEFISNVKDRLRDPDSFEHIRTLVGPIDGFKLHDIVMEYRARNGFGGMNAGVARGLYRNSDCKVMEVSVTE